LGARTPARPLHGLGLAALEAQHLRRGVGGLGACGRFLRLELEIVLRGRVVEAQSEQARDHLGAEETGRRSETLHGPGIGRDVKGL